MYILQLGITFVHEIKKAANNRFSSSWFWRNPKQRHNHSYICL